MTYFTERIHVHIFHIMKLLNKNTNCRKASINYSCAIEPDVFLANDALRQHNYGNLQSNGKELSEMFSKYFA